jgi:hypothetical protein
MQKKKPRDFLSYSVMIPRDLFNELDDMRTMAIKCGTLYDPTDAIIKALRLDLKKSKAILLAISEHRKSHYSV